MPTGKVKWFDRKKGFGFITSGELGDVFVHYQHIMGDGYRVLHQGEPVEFEVEETDKGLLATQVNQIEPATPEAE